LSKAWRARAAAACLLLLLPALAAAAAAPASEASRWEPAIRAAERDLCGRQVALLGENGFHGDGKTVAFKAELVRRLVTRCGFRAVFFEASHYDFIAVQRAVRRREPVTEAMVASAIGRIWNRDRELAPLIPFLAREAQAGRVVLGGLDDQLGSAGAFYSLEAMPVELAAALPPPRREPCRAALRQRIWFDYSVASPHDAASLSRLRACFGDMAAAHASATADRASRAEYRQMLLSAGRAIERDFFGPKALIAGRDRSMYLNFRWLAARLPPGSKIVVWAANPHVARDAAAAADYTAGASLGAFLHREYGRRSFALGFSAASGAFGRAGGTATPIPRSAPDSVEGMLAADNSAEAVYAGPARLAALGRRPASLFDHGKAVLARWADLFDGIVTFRSERPPEPIPSR
jgi:erythromycin esterase-like protein